MSRAILTTFHCYTPDWGQEYYQPILDFYINNMEKFKNEFDHIYFIDSNWHINPNKVKNLPATIININPNYRYYDAYKEVLPQIKEDTLLFMDDDMVIYRPGIINAIFGKVESGYDVAGIYDTIGEWKFKELNNQSKFCLYFFCVNKNYLMKYKDVDWSPNMPQYETLGLLSKKMVDDGVKAFEYLEDKSNIYFDGTRSPEEGLDMGYYHIRSGSVPALLLAYKKEGKPQYKDYIDHQPKNEYLRQMAWYCRMRKYSSRDDLISASIFGVLRDSGISIDDWADYFNKFVEYHGL